MSNIPVLRYTTWLAVVFAFLSVTAPGQQQPPQPQPQRRPPQTAPETPPQPKAGEEPGKKAEEPEDKLFSGMKYRLIGPFRGGRSLAASGVSGNPNLYYFGAVGGGVWKSTNGALTWEPLFDKQPVSSIGALAVAPSDPNVVYVGTGEACIRGNISHGDGIYKSLDAGKTWKNIGLPDSRAIARILVHPRNPDVALVAALGHQYGPNEERGIFRTIDGGKTWQKVLYKDPDTGGIDLSFDPANPNIVFAALWQARRYPWDIVSGGPGSGLYRSSDGGATWKKVEGNGLPSGIMGRIAVSVAANSDRVYALIEHQSDGGLYRSDDGGNKWQLVNRDRHLRQRAWYYIHVTADPKDADKVYVQNVLFHRSTDGGRTFNKIRTPHGDYHGMWIDPENTARMIVADDGGATVTVDDGKTWTRQDNQPTAQFYHVITDNRWPYYVYGSQQDNSNMAIASRSDDGVIDRSDWYPVAGGESGHVAIDPRDSNIVYAGSYEGEITRYDKRSGHTRQIAVNPQLMDGHGAADLEHRFQWTAPILISPHDPDVVYHAGERLFMTRDGGSTWTAISPDLSRNDKSKQQVPGGPVTKEATGVEVYGVIFALAESALAKGQIWAGTNDGLIHITRDGGKNWTNITPKDLPESVVSLIEASPHHAGTAYVAVDRHQQDDLKPYIYKTADYGKTWARLDAGIPEGSFVRAVREDPKRRGLLYAGTENGVFVSFDDGKQWRPLKLNLPTSPIHDLVVKDNDLVVATHGRSFWILDDVTPLRQFSAQVAQADAHLYKPAAAIRYHGRSGWARAQFVGQNPATGAVIDFYLKAEPKGETTVEILDAQGKTIRKYSSEKTNEPRAPLDPEDEKPKKEVEVKAGLNRFVWDLRHEGIEQLKGYYLYYYREGAEGAIALPGSYQVRVTAGGKSMTAPLELALDPRSCTPVQPDPKCTPERAAEIRAGLEKQFNLIKDIQREIARVYDAIRQSQDVQAQMKALRQRLPQNASLKTLATASTDLDKKIAAVQAPLVNFKIEANQDSLSFPYGLDGDLSYLAISIAGEGDHAPTQAHYKTYERLKKKVDEQVGKWQALVEGELAAFQKLAAAQNLQPIMLPQVGTSEAAGGRR